MTKMASRPSDATVVVFQDERDHNKNDIKKKKERTNSNTIQADSKATELSLVAAGCTGCAPLRFESDGTTSFDASAGDDVTPTTSSSGSTEKSEVDSAGNNTFAAKKGKAEGMMDIALLTANANQLRFLITYNTETKTFYISTGLIVLSLIIQVLVGMALIFKRQMKKRGKRNQVDKTSDFLVSGVFLVTVINVLAASFTTTTSPETATATSSHSHLAKAAMISVGSSVTALATATTIQPGHLN